jgi:solute carrier family 13 (sodium-dependent dicarboxylate transporter), member 2/3/5
VNVKKKALAPRIAGKAAWMKRFGGRFGLVLVLTAGTLLLPTPDGLSAAGHRSLAAFVFTSSILALEPVSLPIAALMVPLAVVALGIATAPEAFQTFSRPVVFLILASLFLAEALRKLGLTRRMAMHAIILSGGGTPALLFGLMSISALFSMWVGNTATGAMLIPVALTIARQVSGEKSTQSLLALLTLGVAYSASLGGMATILGGAANAVASGFLAELGPWSFIDWMKYGLPSFVILFPLTWWLLLKLQETAVAKLDVEPAREEIRKMGPMTRGEKEVLAVMLVAAVLWIGGPFAEGVFGLPRTLFSSAIVAVMAVSYLAVRMIITWEDLKGVSWGIFLIIGAGLSLGETLTRTGATQWFSGLIAPLVTGPSLLATLVLLVLISALLTNLLNNTTIAAVFVPVLIALSSETPDIDPVQLVLPVVMATAFGYSLPSASGRMALIASTGIIDKSVMFKYGLIVTVVSSVVLALFFYLLTLAGLI